LRLDSGLFETALDGGKETRPEFAAQALDNTGGSDTLSSLAKGEHMLKINGILISILLASMLPLSARARTFHVDAIKGDDRNDGLTLTTAFQRIQKATDVVKPGDEVIIQPGVYFGPVELRAKGTKDTPIVFRASEIGENRIIITNADPKIRAAEVKWNLEDGALRLYSVPFAGEWPARVLYSGVDLFPYRDVERLKAFTADNDQPGPHHGYTFDPITRKLYARLHAEGNYGATDPNKHLMAVAPATGTRFDGTFITKSQQYCFGARSRR
jgi:hypothetical protein